MNTSLEQSDLRRVKLALDVYIDMYRDTAEKSYSSGNISTAERNAIMIYISRFEKTRGIIVDIQKEIV